MLSALNSNLSKTGLSAWFFFCELNADQSISLEPVQYYTSYNRFESFRDYSVRICYSVYFN